MYKKVSRSTQYKNLFTISGEKILGPLVINKNYIRDNRGGFFESWNKKEFNTFTNQQIEFVQDNHSVSELGVLRGMHYQLNPNAQGKLVRCIYGSIFDVIVDLRINSPTFSKWAGLELSSKNLSQLWVPIGFAHGFLTLTRKAEVLYKTTNFWNKFSERSIKWNDPQVNINWPIKNLDIILSEKDKNSPFLKNLTTEELF